MKRPPIPRPAVYDLYWYFAAERQAAFLRRMAGQAGPWSEDPILQTYKFCNVFRAADRVSQFLIREVIYGPEAAPADQLFQIVLFRLFSRPETWSGLTEELGHAPVIEDLDRLTNALEAVRQRQGKLYTHAFILCAADAYGQGAKYLNHVELLRHMFVADGLDEKLLTAGSLREIYDLLHSYPLIGDFMAYQIAIDLNYSELINFSENDFTQPGPGAKRGLAKVFISLGDFSPAETILWMVERQEEEFERLGLEFSGLFGRQIHAIDAQGLFCEVDKYTRVALPQLASARSKIKAKFAPSATPLPLFFPPKWELKPSLSAQSSG
jgi:hypothetical protein